MKYTELSKEDFDAIVTGELTHYALWLEDELNGLICDYFFGEGLFSSNEKTNDFIRLILQREGLTSQDKIDIVRGMIPLFGEKAEEVNLKSTLSRIEEFKSWRNAMAHGHDVSLRGSAKRIRLKIAVISRSGKVKMIEISPSSHAKKLREADKLLEDIRTAREHVRET
jgi:hypothetical protein